MVKRRHRAGIVALALVSAVALPSLGVGATVEATSWIDAPLGGSVLPVAATTVVSHSADERLVREVVLEVDGVVAASRQVDPPARMATSRFEWLPPASGTYELVVRALNDADEWGAPAAVIVIVSETAPLPTAGPSVGPIETGLPSPGTSGAAGSAVPGTSATPTRPPVSSPPGATPTPAPTRSTATKPPGPTPCVLPNAQLLSPPDDTVEFGTGVEIPFEWAWSGPTSCLDHFVLIINLDQQVEEYAAGGYTREFDTGSETVFQPPITFLPDDSDVATGCGYYSWAVQVVDRDGNGEPGNQVWSFKVCPPDG